MTLRALTEPWRCVCNTKFYSVSLRKCYFSSCSPLLLIPHKPVFLIWILSSSYKFTCWSPDLHYRKIWLYRINKIKMKPLEWVLINLTGIFLRFKNTWLSHRLETKFFKERACIQNMSKNSYNSVRGPKELIKKWTKDWNSFQKKIFTQVANMHMKRYNITSLQRNLCGLI